MNLKIEIHNRNYESRRKTVDNWKIPAFEKKKILEFLDELELGRVNQGKKISRNRLCKYIAMLKVPLEFWNKNLTKVTLEDVKEFERSLINKTLLSKKGVEYSESTKADLKIATRIYFKWRLGEEKATKLTGWLDARVPAKTPAFLKEEEVELLYRSCRNAKERYLIAVLFDTGARAEEFLNIRYEDVFMPKESVPFVKMALKKEYSKTKGRTISLYWKHSLEAVRDYIREREREGIKHSDPVFEGTYDQSRHFLRRLASRVLKKPVHFHLFRHSSATYYASKLNRQQLCIRYGWTFSSDMPDIYIARAGVEDKDLDEKMAGNEIEKIRDGFDQERVQMKIKQENMENELKEFKIKLNTLVNTMTTLQPQSS